MPYEVILTRPALRVYQKLPYKLKAALDRCIIELEDHPKYGPNIERLKSKPHHFKYQVGGWRIPTKWTRPLGKSGFMASAPMEMCTNVVINSLLIPQLLLVMQ